MTRQPRVRTLLAALVMSLALAASATSAWAHPRVVSPSGVVDEIPTAAPVPVPAAAAPPAPVAPPDPTPGPTDPLAPAMALAVVLGVALTARRRVLVTTLALVLVVLAVETGVHSVHHLADQQGASECVVALASAHVHGTAEPLPAAHAMWIPVPVGAVVAPAPERPGARPLRPDEGRAPPAA